MSGLGNGRTFWEQLGETPTAISFAVLYAAVMFLARVALSPNLSGSEAQEMLFGQSLQWGYRPAEPPLATWLAWAALTVSHGSRLALLLLREIIVAVGLIAFFFAARDVLGETRRAALAAAFLTATFGVGWLAHFGNFEITLTATTCCLYLWAYTRALTRQGTLDNILLGIVTGVGVLAGYAFLVLPFSMSTALVFVPELRKRVRLLSLLPGGIIALAILAPYLALAPDALSFSGGAGRLSALRDLLIALVLTSLPATLVFLGSYPRIRLSVSAQRPVWLLLFRYTMTAALLVAGAVALLLPAEANVLAYPVLLPLSLYLFTRAQLLYEKDARQNDNYLLAGALACIALGIAVRIWMYETRAHDCRTCAEYWPMVRYADTFRQAGFYEGTIVAPNAALGGNLKLVFPKDRVVASQAPASRFGPPVPGECLIVWPGNTNIPSRLRAYVESTYGAKLQDRALQGDVEAKLLTATGHLARMNFLILAQGACDRPRG